MLAPNHARRLYAKFGLVFLLLLTGTACSNLPNNNNSVHGEHLITPYYADLEDWQISEQQIGNFSSRIWLKPDRGMADAYSVSVFYNDVSLTAEKRRLLDDPGFKACDRFTSSTLVFPKPTYPTEYWETHCDNDDGTRAQILHLVIQGQNKVYHIQKSWQGDISIELVEQWKSKLESVFICDTRTHVTECPEIQNARPQY